MLHIEVTGASIRYVNLAFAETLRSNLAESQINIWLSSEAVAKKIWSGEVTIVVTGAVCCVR